MPGLKLAPKRKARLAWLVAILILAAGVGAFYGYEWISRRSGDSPEPDLESTVFPNHDRFDDGAIEFRTNLARETVRPLYYGLKEVEAQFHRVTQTILPFADDPNDVLTIRLYAAQADYETYQPVLFGLPVDNGGLYVETTGTIYGFQRNATESPYTLEDLLRHEYAHYLIGRHLLPGFWGESDFTRTDRTVWFDEGFAEFLVGSSARDGVTERRELADLILGDGTQRLSIQEILTGTGVEPRLHRYAGTLFFYLKQATSAIPDLVDAVRSQDAARFDAWVAQALVNATLASGYQEFLDDLVANRTGLIHKVTTAPEPGQLSANLTAIQSAMRETRMGYQARCSLSAVEEARFSCRGTLTGTPTTDPLVAAASFDRNLDELLDELAANATAPVNVNWTVCRFGPIEFVASGNDSYPAADYFCDGPLATSNQPQPERRQRIEDDFHAARLGAAARCGATEPGVIRCLVPLATQAQATDAPDDVFHAELSHHLGELQRQVYAASPSLYRSFSCTLVGAPVEFPAGPDARYLVQDASCAIA